MIVMEETQPLISKATVNALLEVLAAHYVIGTIMTLFNAQGIDYDESYIEGPEGSLRRLEGRRYLRTLDLTKSQDAAKLLEVIRNVLLIGNHYYSASSPTLLALRKRIEADGYFIVGDRIVRGSTPIHESVDTTINRLDLNYVRQEWDRALKEIESDPADAITASCSLIESTCKAVLDKLGIPYPADRDVQHLYKAVTDALHLAPDKVVEAELKRIFGGAVNVVLGIGVLRTKVGDAHGRGEKDSLIESPAAARYVVQLAGATSVFLIEMLEAHLQSLTVKSS